MGMMIGSRGNTEKDADAGKVKAQTLYKVSKSTMPKANTIVKHTVDYLPSSNMANSAILLIADRFNGGIFDLTAHGTEYSELNQHRGAEREVL
jgi:hypothetical protein